MEPATTSSWGGAGSDALTAGRGDDTLDGGGGSDTFVFNAAHNDTNRIENFGSGDTIRILSNNQLPTASQIQTLVENVAVSGGEYTYTFENLTIVSDERLTVGDFETRGGTSGTSTPGTTAGTHVGDDGDNVLDGGPGDDTLKGLDGNDDLIGRDGNDVLIGGAGSDTLHGWDHEKRGDAIRDGSDTASYEDAPTRVIATLNRTNDDREAPQIWDNITERTADAHVADWWVHTDPGVNMPEAEHARDDVFYSIENLRGSDYHDTLQGDGEDNTIEGLEGNDLIAGLGGNDTLVGGEGHDGFDGGGGDDSIEGGSGKDTLTGGGDNDTLRGGDDGDTLYGDAGLDILYGGAGADVLNGGEPTETGAIATVGDDDTLIGGAGADTLYGGIASYEGSSAVTVILDDDAPEEGGDAEGDVLDGDDDVVANDVKHVIGSDRNDLLRGDAGDNTLEGGDGNDTLIGVDGDDLLDGGDGTDTASYNLFVDSVPDGSQTGSVDVALGEPGTGGVGITGTGTLRNIENLIGSWGNDELTGNSGANDIQGIQGNDTIEGRDGADTLDGGEGVDTLTYENSTDADGVTINLGSNSARGGEAAGDRISNFENVTGTGKADRLTGSDKENVLVGGDGNDTLDGGSDDVTDTLTGGDGEDVFIFRDGDIVNGFSTGDDKLDVSALRGFASDGSDLFDYINVSGNTITYDRDGSYATDADPDPNPDNNLTMTVDGLSSENADYFDF